MHNAGVIFRLHTGKLDILKLVYLLSCSAIRCCVLIVIPCLVTSVAKSFEVMIISVTYVAALVIFLISDEYCIGSSYHLTQELMTQTSVRCGIQ